MDTSTDETEEDQATSDDVPYELDGNEIIQDSIYTTLLDGITTIVDFSREFSMSDGESVRDIRFTGRELLNTIDDDEYLTPSEKADALRAAAKKLQAYLEPKPMEREYKALSYVIRILSARQVFLENMMNSVENLFDLDEEEGATNEFSDDEEMSENEITEEVIDDEDSWNIDDLFDF